MGTSGHLTITKLRKEMEGDGWQSTLLLLEALPKGCLDLRENTSHFGGMKLIQEGKIVVLGPADLKGALEKILATSTQGVYGTLAGFIIAAIKVGWADQALKAKTSRGSDAFYDSKKQGSWNN